MTNHLSFYPSNFRLGTLDLHIAIKAIFIQWLEPSIFFTLALWDTYYVSLGLVSGILTHKLKRYSFTEDESLALVGS